MFAVISLYIQITVKSIAAAYQEPLFKTETILKDIEILRQIELPRKYFT